MATALDGDTLSLNGERIRLYGIDAFEAEQLCKGKNGRTWGCGGVATRAMQGLVAERLTICFPKERDTYGRIVAVCRNDGVDLASAMVVRGLALAYRKYAQDYVAEEGIAKSASAGAWAGTFDVPENFRRAGPGSNSAIAGRSARDSSQCVIKGNINSEGRKLFHLPDDASYERVRAEVIFCSVDEASAAGFERPQGAN